MEKSRKITNGKSRKNCKQIEKVKQGIHKVLDGNHRLQALQ